MRESRCPRWISWMSPNVRSIGIPLLSRGQAFQMVYIAAATIRYSEKLLDPLLPVWSQPKTQRRSPAVRSGSASCLGFAVWRLVPVLLACLFQCGDHDLSRDLGELSSNSRAWRHRKIQSEYPRPRPRVHYLVHLVRLFRYL